MTWDPDSPLAERLQALQRELLGNRYLDAQNSTSSDTTVSLPSSDRRS